MQHPRACSVSASFEERCFDSAVVCNSLLVIIRIASYLRVSHWTLLSKFFHQEVVSRVTLLPKESAACSTERETLSGFFFVEPILNHEDHFEMASFATVSPVCSSNSPNGLISLPRPFQSNADAENRLQPHFQVMHEVVVFAKRDTLIAMINLFRSCMRLGVDFQCELQIDEEPSPPSS